MENRVELSDQTLRITRIFDAPRELVFEAWSDPDRIEAWSGCAEATSLEATVDFRVGGGYRHVISIPEVGSLTMFGTYTEIRPPERIVYTVEWEPFESIDPVPPTEVSVEFVARGDQTEVRLTHSGLVSDEMKENIPEGWGAAFDRLANGMGRSQGSGAPTKIVRDYFREFFSGPARHSEVRRFLTDDFVFRGPMLCADSADEYVEQLRELGDELDLRVTVRQVLGEGDRVAALVDMEGPAPVTFSQWFSFEGDRISRLEVVYDPRPFLEGTPGG